MSLWCNTGLSDQTLESTEQIQLQVLSCSAGVLLQSVVSLADASTGEDWTTVELRTIPLEMGQLNKRLSQTCQCRLNYLKLKRIRTCSVITTEIKKKLALRESTCWWGFEEKSALFPFVLSFTGNDWIIIRDLSRFQSQIEWQPV